MRGRDWAVWALAIAVLAFGVLFFFRYRDPMILVFALIAAGIMATVVLAMRGVRRGVVGGIRVRCRECRALNIEDARFCSQCGQSMQ